MGAPEPNGSAVHLDLFGGPRVRTSRGNLALSPNQELLLTLVWGHEAAGLTRRKAIGLLWEEADDSRSRQRLRQLLHELRRRLACDVIDAEGDDLLHRRPGALSSDLEAFRQALSDGDLRLALGVQRQEFGSLLRRLPGEAFEDWLEAKRARLRRELREAAAVRWDQAQPRGRWPEAREAAEVLYALDPTSEQTVRMIIEARGMTGGFEGAEAAFSGYLETLGPHGQPTREILQVVERVRRMAEMPAAVAPGTARRDERIPLIGRETELGAVREALDRIRGGTFEFVLLKGDAGVGKTRLLDEAVREAYLKGFRCLRASPVELEQRIPLNPLVDALNGEEAKGHVLALDNPWKAVMAAVLQLREPGEDPLPLPPIQESSLSRRLYEAFSILFARMAAAEPTLLIIDDIQWADATTVAVLQFIQRRWRAGPFGVIAALRPERGLSTEQIARYLDPGGDLAVTPVEIRDLDLEDAARLVTVVAGERLGGSAVQQLTDLGGCNPFYLIEITRDYMAGRFQLPDTPMDEVPIPISLRQLVDSRLEHLSEDAIRAASVLATWGHSVRLVDLAALLDIDLDDCVEVVEELARWRLVEQNVDEVRFAHALFRSALYGRLNEARKVMLHKLVAERLLTRDPAPPDELAIHFARAGDAARAVQFARMAAATATDNGALAEAAYFFQVVVDNETDLCGKAEATADLARLLHMKREIARANPLLEMAAARLRAVGNRAAALRMDIRRVDGLAGVEDTKTMADLRDRLSAIKNAARTARDWEALALALDVELHLLHRMGRIAEIRTLFHEMRKCAAQPDLATACVANASLATNIFFGDCSEGMRCANRAVELAEQIGDPRALLLAFHRLVVVHAVRGTLYLPDGEAILRQADRLAHASGDLQLRFDLTVNQGVFFLDAGDLDRAEVRIDRAAQLLTTSEPARSRFTVLLNRGELALERHEFPLARQYFQQAEALLSVAPSPIHAAVPYAGIGLSALDTGASTEALKCEASLPSDPQEWYSDPIVILTFRARLLERRRRAAEAVDLLRHQGQQLAARFPLAFVRAEILASKISRRAGLPQDAEAYRHALAVSQRLELTTRMRQLEGAV